MEVPCKSATQTNPVIDGSIRRLPLNAMNFNTKQNVQLEEDQLITARISDEAGQPMVAGISPSEPDRLNLEDALEMTEDGTERDSVAYTTEWDSDNEDAELEARLAKWFKCNDAKWADLMHQIRSPDLEAVPPLLKPTNVASEGAVEEYDNDFDVGCDLPCMKLSPSGSNPDSPTTPELILPRTAPPVFLEPDNDDIEAWLAESEDGSLLQGRRGLSANSKE